MAGLFLSFLVSPLAAQIDYRNLDDDRPVVTEDAYPMERYAFELLAPYRFEAEADGGELNMTVPEIAYGLARNAQLRLKLPVAGVDQGTGTGTNRGLAGFWVFGLYNSNTVFAGALVGSMFAAIKAFEAGDRGGGGPGGGGGPEPQ
jgi:hypothetical protein